MLKIVGVCVLVVLLVLAAFALLTRYDWNPLDRIAMAPAPAAPPASPVVPG